MYTSYDPKKEPFTFGPYLVIYENRKQDLLFRIVKDLPHYNRQTYTSFGWYIVDIQSFYEGEFISLEKASYNIKLEIHKNQCNLKKELKFIEFKRNIKFKLKRKINKIIDKI